MLSANYGPIADLSYAALTNNGIKLSGGSPTLVHAPGSAPNGFKSWLDGRRNHILSQLAGVAAPFEISNNNGANFTTNQASIVLVGKAPVEAAFLRFSGATTNASVTWTSVTNWSIPFTLGSGANAITLQGYDRKTNVLSGLSDSITITYQP
jgi:hypothetical protein